MADDLTGTIIAGKYRVDALTHASENGDLYAATHFLTERPLSIRVLPKARSNKTSAARFFDSARSSAKFMHENALDIADFGTDENGNCYAVCDVVNGETLKATILRDGQLSPTAAAVIARQIASALAAAHTSGVVHGNLTADNVMLADQGDEIVTPKVIHFTTPNAIQKNSDLMDASSSDLAYLAPEQCAGGDVADSRGDIYSLGVILYEMLAGVVPFSGEKTTDVLLKHIEEPPAPLSVFRSDVDPALENVMMKALSKNPEMRHQTAQELYDELGSFTDETLVAAASASGGNFWKTAFMVLIGTAALASALIYATSVNRTEPTTVLQPDANGLPVQPINPATGIEEQTLAAMPVFSPDSLDGSGMPLTAPDTIPGGDNYDPWASGGPPAGAPPAHLPPGGQVITIDPNNPSQFMPLEGGIILVPVPANTATNANVKPTPSPGSSPANSNTATEPATPKPTVSPRQTPPRATPTPPAPANSSDNDGSEPDR